MITLRNAVVILPLASMATALPLHTREISLTEATPDLMEQQQLVDVPGALTETPLPAPGSQQVGGQIAPGAVQTDPSLGLLSSGSPAGQAGVGAPPVVTPALDATAPVTDPTAMGVPPGVAPPIDSAASVPNPAGSTPPLDASAPATVPVADPAGAGEAPGSTPPLDATAPAPVPAPAADPTSLGGAPAANTTAVTPSSGSQTVPDGATDGADKPEPKPTPPPADKPDNPETKPTSTPPPPPPESSGGIVETIKGGVKKAGSVVAGLAGKLNPFS
ncbi:hypothetical protein PspLS_08270 [Pyricularia sp. CBS 133598]|nr:hypothetical protein PspLS_08270 [Pyricularia sp. CBS 133598]